MSWPARCWPGCGTLTDEGVRQVASCPALARLRSLAVWGGGFGDTAAEVIARSPNLGGLECLSFSGHQIGDRGAVALADSPHLGGVTDLVLHGTRGLSERVVRRLRKRFQRLD
jgi:Leucine Rich repeat